MKSTKEIDTFRRKYTPWLALTCLLFLLGGGLLLRHSVDDLVSTVNNNGFRRGSEAQKRRYYSAHQLGTSLVNYMIHHNGILPPMGTMSQAEKALSPYTTDKSIFVSSFTKAPWVSNPSLSYVNSNKLSPLKSKIAFYEVAPTNSNQVSRVVVVFADGSVGTISKYDWPQFRKSSYLP